MSRVGKLAIAIPQGVDVAVRAEAITVKGALGTLDAYADRSADQRR
jgi:large subunit ribosomal protein L6